MSKVINRPLIQRVKIVRYMCLNNNDDHRDHEALGKVGKVGGTTGHGGNLHQGGVPLVAGAAVARS